MELDLVDVMVGIMVDICGNNIQLNLFQKNQQILCGKTV